MIKVVVGRDGMGAGASDADFDAYVALATERLPEILGTQVDVSRQPEGGAQSDDVSGAGYYGREAARDALARVWTEWHQGQ